MLLIVLLVFSPYIALKLTMHSLAGVDTNILPVADYITSCSA